MVEFCRFCIIFAASYAVIIVNIASAEQALKFAGYESTSTSSNASSASRLPDVIEPLSYKLDLVPILEKNFDFQGYVSIVFRALRDTKQLALHCKGLDVQYIYTDYYGLFWLDPANDLLKINLTYSTYQANRTYSVRIRFNGQLRDDKMIGFYRSSYKVGNETRWLAATQFEPTHARMAFPCFDEPRFKATFSISIARKSDQIVISNMPRKEVHAYSPILYSNDRMWDVFHETPPMATYLVAFVVCDFKNFTNNMTVAYARPNAIDDAAHVNNVSLKLVNLMASYTNVSFMLPQLKNIAVPDLNTAMENWGLITYREARVLYNAELSSSVAKESLTGTIAHETSHQWFGDYVTPAWWDYLWLKEGFAVYFQYIIIEQLEPSWRIMDKFVPVRFQSALFNDQTVYNHAVTANVETPHEIGAIFDSISYHKGGSILRMLHHMVGSHTFRASISKYLKDAWTSTNNGTVTPTNLWDAFENKTIANGVSLPAPITQIMEEWTRNVGYPLVEVLRIPNSNRIKIKQKTYNSSRSTTAVTEYQWFIPITYADNYHAKFDNTTPSMWLKPGSEIVFDEQQSPCRECWILVNIQATGYYRVNYFTENWYTLIGELKTNPTKIHHLNRAQLIDDSISLAIDEYLLYDIPFELMKYLDNEEDFVVWTSAINKLRYLYSLYETTPVGGHLKHYIHNRVKNQYSRFGFTSKPGEDHRTKAGREPFVSFACDFDYEPCVKDALAEYSRNSRNYSRIPVDVKKTVLCVALRKSNSVKETSSIWLNLWHLYQQSNVAHESDDALIAMSCSEDGEILKRYLYKTIDENDTSLKRRDYRTVHISVFSREKGVTAGLKLIKSLMPSVIADLISNKTLDGMVNMLGHLERKITTPKQMEILQEVVDLSQESGKRYDSLKKTIQKIHSLGLHQLKLISRRVEELQSTIGGGGEVRGSAISSSGPSIILQIFSIGLLIEFLL